MNELALALWGPERFSEAEAIHRRTWEIQRRMLGEEHIDTLESAGHLGAVCRELGKVAEAEILLRETLQTCQRLLGNEHPCTTATMNNLGLLLEDRREYEPAETLYRRTYESEQRILGSDHPDTMTHMTDLLRVLRLQGKTDETRPLITERLAHLRRAAEQPGAGALAAHAYAWELLNCELADLRDPEAALPVARRAVDLDGGNDANTLETLATAYYLSNDLEQAIATQRLAIARSQAGGPSGRAALEDELARFLVEAGDLAAVAEAPWGTLGMQLGATLIPGVQPEPRFISRSDDLIQQGRFAEAEALLRVGLATAQKTLAEEHWLIADIRSRIGNAVAQAGRVEEAEPLLLEAYSALEGNRHVPASRKRRALLRIIRLYESWPRPAQVAEWRQRLAETPSGKTSAD